MNIIDVRHPVRRLLAAVICLISLLSGWTFCHGGDPGRAAYTRDLFRREDRRAGGSGVTYLALHPMGFPV